MNISLTKEHQIGLILVTRQELVSRTLGSKVGHSMLTLLFSPPFFSFSGKVTRGVNLGGWFILESWMTPSLFNAPDIAHLDVPDEWSFMAAVTNVSSRAEAKSRMKNHWNTWITEQDFAEISAAGLNSVRIPIGYWAFNASSADIEPYQATAQRPYLRNALRWANKYKLGE